MQKTPNPRFLMMIFLLAVGLFSAPVSARERISVLTLQNYLATLGYDSGTIDGIFGPDTEKAIINLSVDQGWTWDGHFEVRDLVLVRELLTSRGKLVEINRSNRHIVEVQQYLQALGYLNGPITGEWDYDTIQAAKEFNRIAGGRDWSSTRSLTANQLLRDQLKGHLNRRNITVQFFVDGWDNGLTGKTRFSPSRDDISEFLADIPVNERDVDVCSFVTQMTLQNEVEKLESQLGICQSRIERISSQDDMSLTICDDAHEQLAVAVADAPHEGNCGDISPLELDLKEAGETIESLNAILAEKTLLLSELEGKLADLESSANIYGEEQKESEDEVNSLKAQVSSLNSVIASSLRELDNAKLQIQTLNNMLAEETERNGNLSTLVSELQDQVTSLNVSIVEIQRQTQNEFVPIGRYTEKVAQVESLNAIVTQLETRMTTEFVPLNDFNEQAKQIGALNRTLVDKDGQLERVQAANAAFFAWCQTDLDCKVAFGLQ